MIIRMNFSWKNDVFQNRNLEEAEHFSFVAKMRMTTRKTFLVRMFEVNFYYQVFQEVVKWKNDLHL